MKAVEIEKNKKEQINSIFDRKPVILATYVLRTIGAIILSVNLILDTSYAFLSTFYSIGLLGFYSVLLIIRYGIPIISIVRNCIYKVNEPIVDDANQEKTKL